MKPEQFAGFPVFFPEEMEEGKEKIIEPFDLATIILRGFEGTQVKLMEPMDFVVYGIMSGAGWDEGVDTLVATSDLSLINTPAKLNGQLDYIDILDIHQYKDIVHPQPRSYATRFRASVSTLLKYLKMPFS